MDWQSIIHDLLASGLKQTEIGRRVGLSQPSVNDLLHGRSKSVRWDVGEKLRELHALYPERLPAAEKQEAA